MIKKFKIELGFLALVILSIFIGPSFDIKFHNLNNSINNIYFKEFFIDITTLGDSLWFFSFSLLLFFLCFSLKKKLIKKSKEIYNKVLIGSLFLFVANLVTGFITQIIKHILGRPRPNQAFAEESFNFDFFNFDSAFHSFPSGHTSTIFVVALTFSIFTPKLRYVYLFFACIVALSRIIVGAHFFTDIIGGVIVAFIGFKITLKIFEIIKKKDKLSSIKKINSNLFFLSLIIFLIFIIFLSIGSSIDIFISNLFYIEQERFVLQSYYIITIFVRKIFLPFLIIYLLILPGVSIALPLKKIYFNFKFKIREVVFIFFTISFNLIVVVNILLKNSWGRARPNDILQLGGVDSFTPWFQFSNACNSNCSFVSGDAAVGFSIIILFFITKNKIFFWMALIFGSILGLVRILEGGHFLSDVMLAAFLIFILHFIQFKFYEKKFINK